jgi:hypothetical protein
MNSREQWKNQLDWLATDADDITTQSQSNFACSRGKIPEVENSLKVLSDIAPPNVTHSSSSM